MVVNCANQTAGNHWTLARNISDVYLGGNLATSTGGSWAAIVGYDLYFKIYEHSLQCYSEDTVLAQGYYSLMGVALQTDSLNAKFTHVVSPVVDFSGLNGIKLDLYSLRTGSNIKIGVHNSNGTLTEVTSNILVSNQWQTVALSLSGVADIDKDSIDTVYITIVNADAGNIFYIDNMLEDWSA